MLVFGHLGIGGKIGKLARVDLPVGWLLLGTVLPDLIDKPLYYGLSYLTGESGAAVGLISGTRTFGHSGILLVGCAAYFLGSGSIRALAVLIGLLTHLGLDLAGDSLEVLDRSATVRALIFPLLGFEFWANTTRSAGEHLAASFRSPYIISGEIIGAALLAWDGFAGRARKKANRERG